MRERHRKQPGGEEDLLKSDHFGGGGGTPEGFNAAPALTGQLSLKHRGLLRKLLHESGPTGHAELRSAQDNHPNQLIRHNQTLNPSARVAV